VHSISPVPQARSSIRVPGRGLSAWPKVASLSLVNGLWMRWLLSRIVKLRGMSTPVPLTGETVTNDLNCGL